MESTNPKENNSDKNKTPSNVPVKDEKKIIMSHIVQKSIRCSKATIDLTTRVIENLLSQDREKIIFLCENGLPDDLPELRSLIWKINLEYLPMNTEEWDKTLKSKRLAYQQYKNYVFKKLEEELKLFDGYDKLSRNEKAELDKKTHKGILEEICKDTNRTHTEMSFFLNL